ncbi:putative immunoglobulin-blocking virulence protein [Metamycoplasma spumans]|uniref:putative immunoglobulin-blocking virulence protein n=1 Tax=Metamycoplasma spumans TaxID=92406 RepID=UPI0034DD5B1C
MKLKRKQLLSTTIVLGTVVASAMLGSALYAGITNKSDGSKSYTGSVGRPYVSSGDKYSNNSNVIGTTDNENLKATEQPKPIVKDPIIITPPPAVIEKEPEKPKPKPKEETKPKEDPKSKPKEPEVVIKKIKKDEIEYYAEEISIPPRVDNQSDIDKGITNRVPYRAEIVPDVGKITGALTDKNIAATVTRAQDGGRAQDYIFGKNGSYREILENTGISLTEKQNYYNNDGNAPEQLEMLWWRYYRLLKNKDTIKKYVDDVALAHFDEWWNSKEKFAWYPPRSYNARVIPLGHLFLLMHIDHTKITKVSDEVKKALARGETIPKYGAQTWVNDRGEWESSTFEPALNKVVGEIERNNMHKRVLGNNSKWSRSGDDILKGKYANWDDIDETARFKTNPKFEKLLRGGGIGIKKYTRKEAIEGESREEARVVTIDVANSSAFSKSVELIKLFQSENIDITGYRIMNIGKTGADQNMDELMKAIPKKIPMVELFFESKNTSSLKYLKDKEIDELSMFTTNKVNSLADDWAINPWAIKGVAWVNMADYNVSFDYNSWDTIYSRITFDNLRFDKEDFKDKSFEIINNGLRMAYWTRNNERIFQGSFGPGLKPDREAGGNSYPMGVDFSSIPEIRSLRGMIFHDIKNPSLKRKLNKIKFFNDSQVFAISTIDLNEAQFSDVLVTSQPQQPRSKIMFSNGKTTNKIRISPTLNTLNLNYSGIRNLNTLISYSDGNFSKTSTEILVPRGAEGLYSTLKSNGFKVRYESLLDSLEIQ